MPGCVAKWRAMSKTQFITFAVSNETDMQSKTASFPENPLIMEVLVCLRHCAGA